MDATGRIQMSHQRATASEFWMRLSDFWMQQNLHPRTLFVLVLSHPPWAWFEKFARILKHWHYLHSQKNHTFVLKNITSSKIYHSECVSLTKMISGIWQDWNDPILGVQSQGPLNSKILSRYESISIWKTYHCLPKKIKLRLSSS